MPLIFQQKTRSARLAIVGGFPPPYGGVSTHLMRLRSHLDQAGLDYVIYNTLSPTSDGHRVVSVSRFRRLWLIWYTLFGSDSCVYLMSARTSCWLAGAFLHRFRGRRVLVRLQNGKAVEALRKGGWSSRLLGAALCGVSSVVCVSRELSQAVAGLGVPPERTAVFPGFLPPTAAETESGAVADEVWSFCQGRYPVIAASGKVATWNGEDLYGLDHLVGLAERLLPVFPRLGIVVCFWDHRPEDQPALERLLAEARAKQVAEHICFNTRRGLFLPVIQRADLFVRPTNTDGDANSVREALFLGTPVLASDVVERPAGTVLFRTRDLDDFAAKARLVLEGEAGSQAAPPSRLQQSVPASLDSYLSFLAEFSRQELRGCRKPGNQRG